jgi:hypothetical protein
VGGQHPASGPAGDRDGAQTLFHGVLAGRTRRS